MNLWLRRLAGLIITAGICAGCYRQVHREVVIHIPKLTSTACFSIIQDALRPLDGMISATADIPNRNIVVRFDSEKIAIKNIEFVIAGAGFSANDIPLNAQAQEQLPAECQ